MIVANTCGLFHLSEGEPRECLTLSITFHPPPIFPLQCLQNFSISSSLLATFYLSHLTFPPFSPLLSWNFEECKIIFYILNIKHAWTGRERKTLGLYEQKVMFYNKDLMQQNDSVLSSSFSMQHKVPIPFLLYNA